ncbi:MAG: hypothetical protein ACK5RE_11125 [Pseudanabaena sp.]
MKTGVSALETYSPKKTVWEPNVTWHQFIESAIASNHSNFRASEPQEDF